MAVSYTPAMDILPELLLAGILAFLFYVNFRKLNVKANIRTEFILVRGDSLVEGGEMGSWTDKTSPLHEKNEFLREFLQSSHMVFLTVTLWIALTMVMIPVSKLYLIFPRFGSAGTLIVYGLLATIITVSLVTTVVSRIKVTRLTLVLLLVSGGAGVFISFYLPLMYWASSFGQILKLVFVYCAVAVAEFGIYYMASIMKERNTVRVATIGSYVAYFFTSALLALNLFTNLF